VTLRLKLFVLVAATVLFAATGVTSLALWRELVEARAHLECEGSVVAASVAASVPPWLERSGPLPGARLALEEPLARALRSSSLLRAWVVDRDGRVVACADPGDHGCPPGLPSAVSDARGPIDAISGLARQQPLESSAPVVKSGLLVGAVRVSHSGNELANEAKRLAFGVGLVSLLWIGLGLAFASLLLRRITRPLSALVHAAESLPADVPIQLEVEAEPELQELVAAFNRMSARLVEARAETQSVIDSLNERVAIATAEGLRAERLASLGAISAGMAHEMGNSLHVIAGFTKVVLRELPAESPHKADLAKVARETDRAAGLLERFLFFARARSAQTEIQPVGPILQEALEVVGPAAHQAKVTCELELEEGLPEVKIDAELLRQALLNLCLNAVQAMAGRPGGRLVVRGRRLARPGLGMDKSRPGSVNAAPAAAPVVDVVCEVEDNGPGIEPSVRPQIFEPFFTTKAKGTGLGLAIVRQAAEANGGAVEVESELGKGTLFRIRIPMPGGTILTGSSPSMPILPTAATAARTPPEPA
jgi:signal transduction histidine kinase